jgi:DNA-directed RNA polymerase subunit RPC12/RpoP
MGRREEKMRVLILNFDTFDSGSQPQECPSCGQRILVNEATNSIAHIIPACPWYIKVSALGHALKELADKKMN